MMPKDKMKAIHKNPRVVIFPSPQFALSFNRPCLESRCFYFANARHKSIPLSGITVGVIESIKRLIYSVPVT